MGQNIITSSKQRIKQMLDNTGKRTLCSSDIAKETTVVSFDIFDTLVIRDVNKPTDVFGLMEQKLGIPGFREKRIAAERKARISSPEITITDIYRSFEDISEDMIDFYVENELKTELSVCHANQEIMEFYNECLKKFKVIILSDMYLPEDMIRLLLDNCGISGYFKIYISCEHKISKGNKGALFDYVAKDLGVNPKAITHIGNDYSSDYFNAKKNKLNALKLSSKRSNRLLCNRKRIKLNSKSELIYNFINNTTQIQSDYYYRFGYENFGVLLWGFCKWLIDKMKTEGVEQVLFVARDGYIIKKVYDSMNFSEIIPSYYFEMSRRSVVVPSSLSKALSYREMLKLITIPARINIRQIFDAWGLDIENYIDIVSANGVSEEELFRWTELSDNKRLQNIYELIKNDIKSNAESECQLALKYIDQFHFEKKTALVDIGWGGTIQKRLIKVLKQYDRSFDIIGYYLALDRRTSKGELPDDFKAQGYMWDHFNEYSDDTEEMPFVGLFESLFLEQSGSVKNYVQSGDMVVAKRYLYEYLLPGRIVDEIECVSKIQRGAHDFVRAAQQSSLSMLTDVSGEDSFSLLRNCIFEPTLETVNKFRDFRFFDVGAYSYLVRPQMSIFMYLIHLRQFADDFFKCMWPIGFFKELLRVNISYERLWRILKLISKLRPDQE